MSEAKEWFDLTENQALLESKPEAPNVKRKAKAAPEPAHEPAPEPAPQAASFWADEPNIECPKGKPDEMPKLVSSEDCFHCKDKNGYPEYEGGE